MQGRPTGKYKVGIALVRETLALAEFPVVESE
jgi:hypothetical protein